METENHQPPAPVAPYAAVGRRILRDPPVWALAGSLLLIALIYAAPVFSAERFARFADYYAQTLLLGVTLFAIRYRLGTVDHIEERRFWNLWTGALASWLLLNLAWIVAPDEAWTLPSKIGGDLLYLGFYAFILVAVAANPHLPSGWSRHNPRYRVESIGAVLFAAALLTYFVLIPSELNSAAYETYVPSLLFYVSLDVLLVVTFLYLARSTASRRWRMTYLTLAIAGASWAVTDSIEGFMYAETIPEVASGSALDFLWYLTFVPLVVAARLRDWNGTDARVATETPEAQRPLLNGLKGPIAVYAASLPLLHIAMYRMQLLDESSRLARETCVLGFVLLLGGIAIVHNKVIDRQRETAESRSQQSDVRYRELFDESLSGNYVSTPDGRILACNREFARIFGFSSAEEARRANTKGLYASSEQRAEFLEQLCNAGRLEGAEWTLRRRDGATVTVLENAIALKDERGELVELRGQLIDISRHRELEEQLRQSQRLEAVGLLAGGVAHDFNNVLTGITGFTQLARRKLPPESAAMNDLGRVLESVDRASRLVSQLMVFSRREPMVQRVISLNDEIRDITALIQPLIGENITHELLLASDLDNVRADPGQIHQVLMNLIVNARDAMADGGTLTIRTTNMLIHHERRVGHGSVPPGRYVVLEVTDTGCGMDAATQQRVFEPFFTTKPHGVGTGLGLSTAYGIVKHHGGYIVVGSARARGTTFSVYLPRCTEEISAAPGVATAQPVESAGHEQILLVEDEDVVRAVTERTLREAGYRVIAAATPDEAEALFTQATQGGSSIDLLLTDVMLPTRTGVEVFERLSATQSDLPVLFMTGYTDKAVIVEHILGPGYPLLQKPFSPGTLVDKVREALAGSSPAGSA